MHEMLAGSDPTLQFRPVSYTCAFSPVEFDELPLFLPVIGSGDDSDDENCHADGNSRGNPPECNKTFEHKEHLKR
ncbi:hypothetical protein N7510_010507 [Penicillium lagena]|uniref:uncharacterized protein n=1 Tax=Penicillium lagena TaxID=94218 RepID=UPI00254157C8|nr:uncharacterized protein N7510_010507 [Penicillium lagena]KAJ5605353.1 hypothetical protein N7510_010507 [Penicillium lagena]